MTTPAPSAPQRPDPQAASGKRGRSWLVLLFSLTTLAVTLAFVSVFYVGFAMVLGCVVAFIGFHYFVWGWWLGPLLEAETDEDNPSS